MQDDAHKNARSRIARKARPPAPFVGCVSADMKDPVDALHRRNPVRLIGPAILQCLLLEKERQYLNTNRHDFESI